jgi:prepilin-type N-terminal cleavage/methylation domain-containing protein
MGWSLANSTTRKKASGGFTIVELIIVVVVIGILAAITIVSYNGIQQRARDLSLKKEMNTLQEHVEIYRTRHGNYPITTNNPKANWHAADAQTDDNCTNGSSQADWIPDVDAALPQSNPNTNTGVDAIKGCFIYVSDGVEYVISAWNMLPVPQTESFYRRVGFRQFQSESSTQFYTCNVNGIGGVSGGDYDISQDYYKHSYTISNITDCDETPPSGA